VNVFDIFRLRRLTVRDLNKQYVLRIFEGEKGRARPRTKESEEGREGGRERQRARTRAHRARVRARARARQPAIERVRERARERERERERARERELLLLLPKWCMTELGRLPGRRCAWLQMRFGREYPQLMGASSFYSLKREFLQRDVITYS